MNEKSKNFTFIYRYDIKMGGQVAVLHFPRNDCKSRTKTGAVCTQGIPEPQPQAGGAWKEEYEAEDGLNQRSDEIGQQKDPAVPQEQAIRTGTWQLDHALDGGIPSGSLTFISGTPSSGKSILCQHIAYEALRAGHGVAYLLADDTNDVLISQMNSIGMDVLGYLQSDKFRICPITGPLDDDCEMAEQSGQSIRTLASQIQGLPNQLKVTVVDDITDCATDSTDRALLRFFTNCKRLTKDGRTIILVSQSYAFDEGFTARLRDVCDAHLTMRYEMFSERPISTLGVVKFRGAELNVPSSISFIVEPGIGMTNVPFGKFKV